METELWPNLLNVASREGIKICLLNARLSARSARRYRRISSLTKRMLACVDLLISQYQDTVDRFTDLGFPSERTHVTGNVKFDLDISTQIHNEISLLGENVLNERRCWIAASTHPGEDEVALDAHIKARETLPNLLLVLAPRHPHRADQIQQLAAARSLASIKLSDSLQHADVLIVDRMGELLKFYGLAEVAFVGGSLQGTGGHNPIEPAALGTPMLMGPDRMNFEEVCARFSAAGCLTEVRSHAELALKLVELLSKQSVTKATK